MNEMTYENYINVLSKQIIENYCGYELTKYMNEKSFNDSIIAYKLDMRTKLNYIDWLNDHISFALLEVFEK